MGNHLNKNTFELRFKKEFLNIEKYQNIDINLLTLNIFRIELLDNNILEFSFSDNAENKELLKYFNDILYESYNFGDIEILQFDWLGDVLKTTLFKNCKVHKIKSFDVLDYSDSEFSNFKISFKFETQIIN